MDVLVAYIRAIDLFLTSWTESRRVLAEMMRFAAVKYESSRSSKKRHMMSPARVLNKAALDDLD